MKISKCLSAVLSLCVGLSAALLPAAKAYALTAPVISTYTQVTKNTSITLKGTADPGSTITVTGGLTVATATTQSNGSFSVSVKLIAESPNYLFVTATLNGEESPAADAFVVQDDEKPAAPVILTPAQVTYQDSIVLSGTAEPGTLLTIKGGSQTVTTGVSGTGAFDATVPLKLNSVNSLSCVATDNAGNASAASTVKITQRPDPSIDTTPPAKPTVAAPVAYTPDTTLILTGTAEPGSTVKAMGGLGNGTVIGTAAGDGSFSLEVHLAEDTLNTFSITATDAAGNVSAAATVKTTQDDIAPVEPTIETTAQTTTATNITVLGTAEAGSTVTVTGGEQKVSAAASSSGDFKIVTDLVPGAVNNLTVTSTDKAGNVSAPATVEITQEANPDAPTVSTPSQSTSNMSITVTGTAKPGYMITITGGSEIAIGEADSNGNFSIPVNLNQGIINDLYVMATDSADAVSGAVAVQITQVDNSTTPKVTTPSQTTGGSSILISGTAVPKSLVKITGGLDTITGTAADDGSFNLTVPLNPNVVNNLQVTSTDDNGVISAAVTLQITQQTASSSPSSAGFLVKADPSYTSDGSSKYFSLSVTRTSDTAPESYVLTVVTTQRDGSQSYSSTDYSGDQSALKIYVYGDPVQSSVYLSAKPLDGSSIPETYGLTQFITD